MKINVKLVFMGIAALLLSDCAPVKEKIQSPNIIFILADDMGYADLGCFGQKHIQTPNIDRMATEGIRFTQHYAGNAVCAPARCSLMTGMHMGHAEIRGNKQTKPFGQMPLSDQAVTVAKLLKEAGYRTAMIGKWGLGVEGSSGEPDKQGFDYYYGYLDQVLAHNYYPEYLLRNGQKEILPNKVKYLSKEAWHGGLGSYSTEKIAYSNDLFTEDALRYIDENKSHPFFLYLPYTIPHDNGEALKGEELEVPDYGIYMDKDWDGNQKGYAAMITRLDSYVGQIMQKLQKKCIDQNTLVIFTSDNGPEMGYSFSELLDSNGSFRGGKRDLYEGGIRIPFIARWPGKIKQGTSSDHISAFWDFLPTACDVAGIAPPDNIDGISYLPALQGKQNQLEHEYLYWEFYERDGAKAVRKGNWKAVKNNMYRDPSGAIELFDLKSDPGENTDVAAQNKEIADEMEILMEDASSPSPDFSFSK